MNKIITIVFVAIYFISTAQTDAPINPDFLKYMEKIGYIQSQSKNSIKSSGLIPSIVKPHFNGFAPVVIQTGEKQFPSSYDLRDLSLVTPAKNQLPYGTCWAHAAMGAIESYWLKSGLGAFDLSEKNIATCHDFEWGWNLGGNSWIAGAYFTRMDGPILENDDPYLLLDTDTFCNDILNPVAFESEVRFIPNIMDSIKQSIMDYGALYTTYYEEFFDDNFNGTFNYYNDSTNTIYYCPDTIAGNHAVLVVGWDDNFVTGAPNNGAWIIKNSLGTSWGDSGYIYISYDDVTVNYEVTCFISRIENNPQAFLYYYDHLGAIMLSGYNSEIGYGLTKFIANSDQTITKIGTFVISQGSTIDFEIYDDKNANILSNQLGTLTNQYCEYPGYYMFDLPSGININNGNDFYIKVKYHTPGYNYPIPFETYYNGYSNPSIESNVCWASATGNSWALWGNTTTSYKRDLCIRAYAIPQTTNIELNEKNKPEVNVFPNPFKDNATVIISDKSSEKYRVSICDITGKVILEQTILSNEEISIGKNIVPGVYILNITGNNNEYKNSVKLVKIE